MTIPSVSLTIRLPAHERDIILCGMVALTIAALEFCLGAIC
jgi:hypothetical protein